MFETFTRAQLSQYHEMLFIHVQAVFALLFGRDLQPIVPVGGPEWNRLRSEHDHLLDIMTAVYAEMQSRDSESLTDVPMVCTACRKPVQEGEDNSGHRMWLHDFPGDGAMCPRVDGPVMAMVAAGNESVPLAVAIAEADAEGAW